MGALVMVTVLKRATVPLGVDAIDVTSHSTVWRDLSPFVAGPVEINGRVARNVENAWQFSKVYSAHCGLDGLPASSYFEWRDRGYADLRARRYPMGRGARPVFSWLDGRAVDYVMARRLIYIPLYAEAVARTEAWRRLQELYAARGSLILADFDAYDHRALQRTWADVICDTRRKMGHGFVLAMMLEASSVPQFVAWAKG